MSFQACSPSYPESTPPGIPSNMPSYNPITGYSAAGQGPPPTALDRRPFTQPTTPSSVSPYNMQSQTELPLLPPPPPRPRTHHTYGDHDSASSSYYSPSGMRPGGQGPQGHEQFHSPGPDFGIYPTTAQSFGTHYRAQDSHHNGSDPGVGGSRSSSISDNPIIPNPPYFPHSDPNHHLMLNSSNDRGGPGPNTLSMGSRHGRARKRSSPGPASKERIRPGMSGSGPDEQAVRESVGQTSGESIEKGVHDVSLVHWVHLVIFQVDS